jgi:AbrB family looped-hinge helix DNA binding protein
VAQYFESKITRKGQVTLPADVRKRLSLEPGGKVRWVVDGSDVKVEPVGSIADRTAGILQQYARPMSERELKEQGADAIAGAVMERYHRSLEKPSARTRRKRSSKTPAR